MLVLFSGRQGPSPAARGWSFVTDGPPQSQATKEVTLSKPTNRPIQPLPVHRTPSKNDRIPWERGPYLSFKTTELPDRHKRAQITDDVTLSRESQVSQTLLEIQGQSWVRTFKVPKQLAKVQRPEMLTGFMGHVIDKPNNHVS